MNVSGIELRSIEDLQLKRKELAILVGDLGLCDCAVYHYFKQGTFFRKAEERYLMFFFQGLNTYPQNLSIFMRDEAEKEATSSNKQKITRGIFVVWNCFTKRDCVIQINIPGTLRIYSLVGDKKQMLSNQQIKTLYLSSMLRGMYQRGVVWGRYYQLFQQANCLEQFTSFIKLFIQITATSDCFVGEEYDAEAKIKGSHCCSILINYITRKGIQHQALKAIQDVLAQNQKLKQIPKFMVLISQLYILIGKAKVSVEMMLNATKIFSEDPYFIYYTAHACASNLMYDQAIQLLNTICQYNEYDVWLLLAQCHLKLLNYEVALVCLNLAAPLSNYKIKNNIFQIYKQFESIGKVIPLKNKQMLINFPSILMIADSPLSLPRNLVDPSQHPLLEQIFWRLNKNAKTIYSLLRQIVYKVGSKKFQQILESTFIQKPKQSVIVCLKKGLTQSMLADVTTQIHGSTIEITLDKPNSNSELPAFLQNDQNQGQLKELAKPSRNLSIIPQLQSMIESSRFEQLQAEQSYRTLKLKKCVSPALLKLIQQQNKEPQFVRSEYLKNLQVILPCYNKLRKVSVYNNYYLHALFELMDETANYRSLLILIAETLDQYEQAGIRKITFLPYWIQKYLFRMISQKGLKHLNELLNKLNFIDEAVLDTIQLAQKWRLTGVDF